MKEIIKEKKKKLKKTINLELTLKELKLLYDILYDIPDNLFFQRVNEEIECISTYVLFTDIEKILKSHKIINNDNETVNEIDEILKSYKIKGE